jgi:hypothetical protein
MILEEITIERIVKEGAIPYAINRHLLRNTDELVNVHKAQKKFIKQLAFQQKGIKVDHPDLSDEAIVSEIINDFKNTGFKVSEYIIAMTKKFACRKDEEILKSVAKSFKKAIMHVDGDPENAKLYKRRIKNVEKEFKAAKLARKETEIKLLLKQKSNSNPT